MRKLQLLVAACIACIGLDAMAQAWPTKTVRIISPFPPGGSVDQVARLLAAQLSQQTGQQFIVENRSGASGVIGTQAVAQAPGDGYTLGVVFDTHAVNPSLMANMPYDTLKDLKPVMLVGTSPMALVAPVSQPYKDFRDVLAEAKKKPIPFGTIGAGSLGHLAMAQVAIGGQVPLAIGTVFLVTPHVKAGKLKALAVTSLKPSPQLPGVAPMADQGVPGFSALAWWGVLAPGTTPQPLVRRIYEEFARALKDPALTEKLQQQGMDVQGAPPEELDRFIREQITRWAKVVQDNRIKPGD
jgi:tripartite-type tricarboxylate transporter receptor subunit TctC